MEDKNKIVKRGNFLFRQELKNLTLEPTPLCSMICNLIVGIIFLSVMNPIFKSSNDFLSYRVEYTNCNVNPGPGNKCVKTLEVKETIVGKILVFYEIEDFYINHKEFVRSKKFSQLSNNMNEDEKFFQCEGAQYMYQVKEDGVYETFSGEPLKNTSLAYPCGLFAKYMFNDTFKLMNDDVQFLINETNIAYLEHKDKLFVNNENAEKLQYRDIEDGKLLNLILNYKSDKLSEHFIVWMSPEADHSFNKIWGRLETDILPAGNYTVEINNNWTAGKNLTKKYFKITNVVSLGSDKIFAILLAIFGGISIFFAIVMGVIYFMKRNDEFDPSKMSW